MNAAVRPNHLKRAVRFAKLNRRFEIMCCSPNGVKLRLNNVYSGVTLLVGAVDGPIAEMGFRTEGERSYWRGGRSGLSRKDIESAARGPVSRRER